GRDGRIVCEIGRAVFGCDVFEAGLVASDCGRFRSGALCAGAATCHNGKRRKGDHPPTKLSLHVLSSPRAFRPSQVTSKYSIAVLRPSAPVLPVPMKNRPATQSCVPRTSASTQLVTR